MNIPKNTNPLAGKIEIDEIITKEKTGKLVFRCLKCGKVSIYSERTCDGRGCFHCGGNIKAIGYAKKAAKNNASPPFPVPTESKEQQCLFQWAELKKRTFPELRLMYHVPNEGKRSRAAGGRLRAEGLKAGVPDICLPVPRSGYHGLYMELKRTKGGKITDNQSGWLEALLQQGYFAIVCKGWQEAARVIMDYLKQFDQREESPVSNAEFNLEGEKI